jgi:PadR family transcriptional regulator PadR
MDNAEIDELIPLKPIWLHLLLAIAAGHRHGYAMRKEVERRSAGSVKIWPATLYRGLTGLLDERLVEDEGTESGTEGERERRLYRLTDRGRAVLAAEVRRLEALVAEARDLAIDAGEGRG